MRNLFICLLSAAALLFSSVQLSAQTRTISGVVLDETGEPVIGAAVIETGTKNGTITDFEGNFELEVKSGASVTVSAIGYSDYVFTASSSAPLRIVLKEDSLMLQETVVTAFATQKKVNVTGAITTVKGDDVLLAPVANVSSALVGITPGISAVTVSGEPGQDAADIAIRGISSYSGNTAPLIVIDGIEQPASQAMSILNGISANDILGISVFTFVLGFKDPGSNTLLVTGKVFLFLILSVVVGFIFYKIFRFYDERHAHTRRIPIIAVGLCLAMAYIAEKYFGIADITGAYIAGIILCNTQDAEYIDRRVSINGYMFFAPMFFVGIGLKTDFSSVDSSMILFSVGFVIVAMISKVIGCGLVSKVCRYSWLDSLKIGVGMMTRGEVALIITNKGLGLGIIDSSYFTAVILLIIVSSIVTPLLLKMLFAKDKPELEAVPAEK